MGAAPVPDRGCNEIYSPSQEDYNHAELVLDAYAYHTSARGGAKGAAMLGDEMIDEASRKMALVIAGKGRAAGLRRTTSFEPPAGTGRRQPGPDPAVAPSARLRSAVRSWRRGQPLVSG